MGFLSDIRSSFGIKKQEKKHNKAKKAAEPYFIVDESVITERTYDLQSTVHCDEDYLEHKLQPQPQPQPQLHLSHGCINPQSHGSVTIHLSRRASDGDSHARPRQSQQRRSRSHSQSRRSSRSKRNASASPSQSGQRGMFSFSRAQTSDIMKDVPAIDSQGRCSHHPYVQLQKLSKRTGQWKALLESCPLCDAMEDDEDSVDESILSESSVETVVQPQQSKSQSNSLATRLGVTASPSGSKGTISAKSHVAGGRPRSNPPPSSQSRAAASRGASFSRRSSDASNSNRSSAARGLSLSRKSSRDSNKSRSPARPVDSTSSPQTKVTSNYETCVDLKKKVTKPNSLATRPGVAPSSSRSQNCSSKGASPSPSKSHVAKPPPLKAQVAGRSRSNPPPSSQSRAAASRGTSRSRRSSDTCNSSRSSAERGLSLSRKSSRDSNSSRSPARPVDSLLPSQAQNAAQNSRRSHSKSRMRSEKEPMNEGNPQGRRIYSIDADGNLKITKSLVAGSSVKSRSRSQSVSRSKASSTPSPQRYSNRHGRSASQSKGSSRKRSSSSSSRLTYFKPQKVEELRQFRRMDELDSSMDTVVAGNKSAATSSSSKAPIPGRATGDTLDGEDSYYYAKLVSFMDDDGEATDTKNTDRPPLVTKVHTRPYTLKMERSNLFYSVKDVRKFRRQATLDVLAARVDAEAFDSCPSLHQDGDEDGDDGMIAIDSPLLDKLLFLYEDDKEDEEGGKILPREVKELLWGMYMDGSLEDQFHTLTSQSRNHRAVRKFLHRQAVLYYL